MRRNSNLPKEFFAAAALVICSPLTGQTNRIGVGGGIASSPQPVVMPMPAMGFESGGPLSEITGHPYSAVQESQTVQTLSDGTHITQNVQKVSYYRDSLGRTRTERIAQTPPGILSVGADPPVFIDIVDPVAGYRYSLDSKGRMAHRMIMARRPQNAAPVQGSPTGSNANGAPAALRAVISSTPFVPPTVLPAPAVAARPQISSSQRPQPDTKYESLGSQNIEGVLAEGTRTTTTWPVGTFGNDRPIVTIREMWFSRELGMPVLTKNADPRSGDTTTRLTNISQAEPSLTLFQVPADYQIVDPGQK